MNVIEIAGEIVGAASAASGLILVFIGALSNTYSTYQPQERRSVRGRLQRRAHTAFATLIIAVVTVVFALLTEWLQSPGLGYCALAMLGFALLGVIWTAYATISDIK